jgi:hypothetical protein
MPACECPHADRGEDHYEDEKTITSGYFPLLHPPLSGEEKMNFASLPTLDGDDILCSI